VKPSLSGNKTRARPDEVKYLDMMCSAILLFFFVMLSIVGVKSSKFGLFRLWMVEILASLHDYSFLKMI